MFCNECGRPLSQLPPTTCLLCGAQHWNDAKPCASALVVTGSELLMVRRAQEPWKGMWDVPGGFCGPGEHPITTAEREVAEETGLQVRVIGFFGIWLDEYPEAARVMKRTLNIYYHAILLEPVTMALDPAEVTEARFFSPMQLPATLAFPTHLGTVLESWKRAAALGEFVTPLVDRA